MLHLPEMANGGAPQFSFLPVGKVVDCQSFNREEAYDQWNT